ncbi:hypothetical protein BHE74_00033471 [Ensete ventricosum]|nr:hypothetical protein BHE74_00033471 [Ensete ventricosum]
MEKKAGELVRCWLACSGALLLFGVFRGILHERLVGMRVSDVVPPMIKSVFRSWSNLNIRKVLHDSDIFERQVCIRRYHAPYSTIDEKEYRSHSEAVHGAVPYTHHECSTPSTALLTASQARTTVLVLVHQTLLRFDLEGFKVLDSFIKTAGVSMRSPPAGTIPLRLLTTFFILSPLPLELLFDELPPPLPSDS